MLIICAGTCEYVDNASLEVDMFRRVFDVNVFGAVNAAAVALPLLEAANNDNGKPQIVAVASLSAVTGLPRALQKRIDVTVVNPGFVATEMTEQNDFPMPFMMQPPEAAQCIIKGVAKRRLTVNFPLRLWLSLKLPSLIPSVWYRLLGPRLVR